MKVIESGHSCFCEHPRVCLGICTLRSRLTVHILAGLSQGLHPPPRNRPTLRFRARSQCAAPSSLSSRGFHEALPPVPTQAGSVKTRLGKEVCVLGCKDGQGSRIFSLSHPLCKEHQLFHCMERVGVGRCHPEAADSKMCLPGPLLSRPGVGRGAAAPSPQPGAAHHGSWLLGGQCRAITPSWPVHPESPMALSTGG